MGLLRFFPGPHPYPYGAVRPICRDFSAYREMCFAFTVCDEPLELVISVRSGPGEADKTTHYEVRQTYAAGAHVFRLNLPSIVPQARPHPLDLADLWIVQFFIDRPQQPRTIELHRIWLE
jgi:hypothetical protein